MSTYETEPVSRRMLWQLSPTNRTKMAYLNSVAAALDYGARMVVGFVMIPILVAGLGDQLYGVWTVLRRMTGYLGATGARPTQALRCVIANRQSSTDIDEKRKFVGSSVMVWLLLLPLQIPLAAVVVWFSPSWLGISGDLTWTVRIAAAILCVGPLAYNLLDVPRSILEGENLGFRRMGWSALITVLGGGLTWAALQSGAGLIGIAAASLTTVFLTAALYLMLVRREVSWIGIQRPRFSFAKQFVGLSGWFLLWKLAIKIMMDGDVVILGVLASAQVVTVYSLTKYMPELLVNFVGIVVFGITPGLGGIIGKGDLKSAARIRGEIMQLTWLMTTTVGATILIWNDSFLRLWVGEQYQSLPQLTLLILIMVFQITLIRNDANVIDLTLQLRQKVILGVAAAVFTIVASYGLINLLDSDLIAICAGYICGRAILSVAYPMMVGKTLNLAPSQQWIGVIRPGITTVACFALTYWLRGIWTVNSWWELVVGTMGTWLMITVIVFYVGLHARQRSLMTSRLRTIAKR